MDKRLSLCSLDGEGIVGGRYISHIDGRKLMKKKSMVYLANTMEIDDDDILMNKILNEFKWVELETIEHIHS